MLFSLEFTCNLLSILLLQLLITQYIEQEVNEQAKKKKIKVGKLSKSFYNMVTNIYM